MSIWYFIVWPRSLLNVTFKEFFVDLITGKLEFSIAQVIYVMSVLMENESGYRDSDLSFISRPDCAKNSYLPACHYPALVASEKELHRWHLAARSGLCKRACWGLTLLSSYLSASWEVSWSGFWSLRLSLRQLAGWDCRCPSGSRVHWLCVFTRRPGKNWSLILSRHQLTLERDRGH